MSMKEILSKFPVVIEFPIAWGDMDAFQHVNNVMYFRYFESVRIAYFQEMKVNEIMKQSGIGPILASTQCQFKLPMTYPDTVSVGAKVSQMDDVKFVMKYTVVSHQHQRVAAEGGGLVVYYNYREGKKAPIPEKIKEHVYAIEGTHDLNEE